MTLPDEVDVSELEPGPHEDEPHEGGLNNRLNWLRAGVLGANDGIVSTAGIVMGVAGATSDRGTILVAGVAGLAAGALSMAAGEYVSVSTQKDSELALLEKERGELRDEPEEELEELAGLYVEKGLSEELALEVAKQLTEHDALGAHAEAELGIDPDDITSPWNAALASMLVVHAGSAAAAAHHHPVRPDPADLGHRRLGDRRAGAHRLGEREVRLRPLGPGRRTQRGRRAVRDGDHLRDRVCSRPPASV